VGINPPDWAVADIKIETGSTAKPEWILADKPSDVAVIVSGAVIPQSGHGVVVLTRHPYAGVR
jgi:hypothetical protein